MAIQKKLQFFLQYLKKHTFNLFTKKNSHFGFHLSTAVGLVGVCYPIELATASLACLIMSSSDFTVQLSLAKWSWSIAEG